MRVFGFCKIIHSDDGWSVISRRDASRDTSLALVYGAEDIIVFYPSTVPLFIVERDIRLDMERRFVLASRLRNIVDGPERKEEPK